MWGSHSWLRTRFPAGPAGREGRLRPRLAAPQHLEFCCEFLIHDTRPPRGYTGMTKRPQIAPQHGVLWVALGASLWGTDTVLRRPLTASLSSYQIVFIEHLILTVILLPLWWRTFRNLTGCSGPPSSGSRGVARPSAHCFFTEAIRMGNPTTAVLLQKTQPIIWCSWPKCCCASS